MTGVPSSGRQDMDALAGVHLASLRPWSVLSSLGRDGGCSDRCLPLPGPRPHFSRCGTVQAEAGLPRAPSVRVLCPLPPLAVFCRLRAHRVCVSACSDAGTTSLKTPPSKLNGQSPGLSRLGAGRRPPGPPPAPRPGTRWQEGVRVGGPHTRSRVRTDCPPSRKPMGTTAPAATPPSFSAPGEEAQAWRGCLGAGKPRPLPTLSPQLPVRTCSPGAMGPRAEGLQGLRVGGSVPVSWGGARLCPWRLSPWPAPPGLPLLRGFPRPRDGQRGLEPPGRGPRRPGCPKPLAFQGPAASL